MSAKHYAIVVVGLPFKDIPTDIQRKIKFSGQLDGLCVFLSNPNDLYVDGLFGYLLLDSKDGCFELLDIDKLEYAKALKHFESVTGMRGRLYISPVSC